MALVFIVNFEHVFRTFSSVTINDSEREMFAGSRSLDHRSDTFFHIHFVFIIHFIRFYVIISSKIFSVPVDQCHSLLTKITIFII